jgi:hypothetical protein
MGVHFLIKWQNVEAKGSVDLIDADLLQEKKHKKRICSTRLQHGHAA